MLMDKAYQRKGAKSNSYVGSGFEALAKRWFLGKGIPLDDQFPMQIGRGMEQTHNFDLGSENHHIIVECKSHTWTEGGNVPSAKMKAWNEAMYYFHLAPEWYQKVFFVKRSIRSQTGQSLLDYYLKTFRHLTPPDVHFIEYDEDLEKSFGYEGMKIESASLDKGVVIDGHCVWPGEKYTILEEGWAVYLAHNVPQEWMDRYGETKLQDGSTGELDSDDDMLITSHPVLVALALQFWWHDNGRPIKTAPIVRVPDFDEAVEIVRNREILNGFSEPYARIVPGEPRWRLRNLLSGM